MICYFKRKNSLLASFVSLIFALILLWVPWEFLASNGFWDLDVYRRKFVSGLPLLERANINSVWSFFINEGVWDVFIRWLIANSGFSIEVIFSAISFLILFAFSRFIFIRHGFFSLLLLVNPLVIDLAFSQLRMAFALFFLIIAIDLKNSTIKWGLLIFSTFIHTAMILFIVIFFLCSCFIKNRTFRSFFINSPLVFSVISACCVILTIGPLRELVLGFLGDRRASYQMASSSILYAIFWFFYCIVLFALMKRKMIYDISILMAGIWVQVFLFATLLDIYSLRFLTASFPFIVSSMLIFGGIGVKKFDNLKTPSKKIVPGSFNVQFALSWLLIILFVNYSIVQWYFWVR